MIPIFDTGIILVALLFLVYGLTCFFMRKPSTYDHDVTAHSTSEAEGVICTVIGVALLFLLIFY